MPTSTDDLKKKFAGVNSLDGLFDILKAEFNLRIPFEDLVADLKTNNDKKALAASQGKILKDILDTLTSGDGSVKNSEKLAGHTIADFVLLADVLHDYSEWINDGSTKLASMYLIDGLYQAILQNIESLRTNLSDRITNLDQSVHLEITNVTNNLQQQITNANEERKREREEFQRQLTETNESLRQEMTDVNNNLQQEISDLTKDIEKKNEETNQKIDKVNDDIHTELSDFKEETKQDMEQVKEDLNDVITEVNENLKEELRDLTEVVDAFTEIDSDRLKELWQAAQTPA